MDVNPLNFYMLHKMSVPDSLLNDPATSKQTLQSCYHVLAGQLAQSLKKELFQEAMRDPDIRDFTQKYYIHKTIAEAIREKLDFEFSDVEIKFTFEPDHSTSTFGMAKFHFNWS